MDYLVVVAIIFSMIFLGGFVCTRKVIQIVGDDTAYANKTKENVRSSWYCFIGVLGVLIGSQWLPFIRWVVLIFFGLAFLWSFLFATLSTSITAIFTQGMQDYEWITVLSSFFQSISNAAVIWLVMYRGFGWI